MKNKRPYQKVQKIQVIIIFLIISVMLAACGNVAAADTAVKPVETEDFIMGTVISQKVYGDKAQTAADEVKNKMMSIEALMTINAPGGEINKLNAAAGKNSVELSSETISVLETAKKYYDLSNGSFDITVGPLVKAWGIFTDHPRVLEKGEITKLLKLTDNKSLVIDKTSSKATLEKMGQIVDLGGIAKGHAGDEAIKIYKKNNIHSAYVNLGGNVVVLGSKPDGSPWRIGIQNPRAANGIYIGIIKVTDKAVVTSGDYERFFIKDNVRYHHILDPKSGYPADSGLISTTIVSDVSMDADALSTATFVLGLDRGMKLVSSLKGIEAIFITKDKKIYITDGLKSSFTFDDESKEFKYVEKR
jgi:FAD:protein FMN transferase